MIVVSDIVIGFCKPFTALYTCCRVVIVCLLYSCQWCHVLIISKYARYYLTFPHYVFIKSITPGPLYTRGSLSGYFTSCGKWRWQWGMWRYSVSLLRNGCKQWLQTKAAQWPSILPRTKRDRFLTHMSQLLLSPTQARFFFGSYWRGSHTRTVVRECCKGDDESQWEKGKFDPPPPKNPLTDGHQNLCR